MTKEEKDLLLKDLCGRLPYKVQCYCKWAKDVPNGTIGCVQELSTFLIDEIEVMGNSDYESQICEVKPYLRPISSMTEEERAQMTHDCYVISLDFEHKTTDMVALWNTPRVINWLLEHHFDFMELIPKGLAIEVTKENNPYKE